MKSLTKRILCMMVSATLVFSMISAPSIAAAVDFVANPDASSEAAEPASSDANEGSEATGDDIADTGLVQEAGENADAVEETPEPPSAAEADNSNDIDIETILGEAPAIAQEGMVAPSDDTALGRIDVALVDARPYMQRKHSITFNVQLVSAQNSWTRAFTLEETGIDGDYACSETFSDVPAGTYQLLVTDGDRSGLADFSQTVEFNGHRHALIIYIGTAPESVTGVGMAAYGDVNSDAIVDVKDLVRVVEAIEGTVAATSGDLDLDDRVDLRDLQIMAEQLNNEKQEAANRLAGAEDATAQLQKGENTQWVVSNVQQYLNTATLPIDPSNLSDLINNISDTALFIAPANSEAVSASNPVAVEISEIQSAISSADVSNEGNATPPEESATVKAQGMRITTGMNEVAGSVTAVYDDVTGVERTMNIEFNSDSSVQTKATFLPTADATQGLYSTDAVRSSLVRTAMPMAGVFRADIGDAPSEVSDGTIVINFGTNIAIKRVTLTFTRAQTTTVDANGNKKTVVNLAEISSVEFLNGMAEEVKKPDLNIPVSLNVENGSKQFTISFDREENVTGYEILVQLDDKSQTYLVNQSNSPRISKAITSFSPGKKGKVENGKTYTVSVRSVNGNWRSPYSEVIEAKPEASAPPKAPDRVSAVGGYRYIKVSWGAAEDADTYTLYYREKGSGSAWTNKVPNIEATSYTIENLPDYVTYEVCVSGSNHKGEGAKSSVHEATTIDITPATLPKYKLINTPDENGSYTTNIKSATFACTSPANVTDNLPGAMCVFDGRFETYVQTNDWDLGTSYNTTNHGVKVVFDAPQKVGLITFAASIDNINYSRVKVRVWKADGSAKFMNGCTMISRNDGVSGRTYTLIKLPYEEEITQILVGVDRAWNPVRKINIAEMRFHAYNDIEDRIADMFDNTGEYAGMNIKLRDTLDDGTPVDETLMAQLEERIKEKDPYSGEEYPFRSTAQTELNYARQLLSDQKSGLDDIVSIHTSLSSTADNGKRLNFGGLNAWQPLGRSALENDELIFYTCSPSVSSGNSRLDLYIGQFHGESNQAPKRIGTLPVGRKVFKIPDVSSIVGEQGGQLYVVYTGNNSNERWGVRILGQENTVSENELPRLDLYNVTSSVERTKRAKEYVTELTDYCAKLRDYHSAHSNTSYNERSCPANATDIMLDKIMYSVPASQILSGCSKGVSSSDIDAKAAKLLEACDGADQTMELLYQHKGLMDDGPTGNISPARHLNIRYTTMFAGAFMYAAGDHVGIEYPECSGLMGISTFGNGKNGKTYSWGYAHEIGHNINDGSYAYAEVTNNYFASVCRWINEGNTRFKYPNVYKQVTSGASAHSGNVFTQLAMYWQLMLAFDNVEPGVLFNDYNSLAANRFFARLDSYSRNPSSFSGSVPLTLSGEQQNIIRLACAASGKDLRDFFKAWGFVADDTTNAFAAQFPKETRSLQYGCEQTATRLGDSRGAGFAGSQAIVDGGIQVDPSNSSQVKMFITPSVSIGDIHGIEIIRNHYEEGNIVSEVVGFTQSNNGQYFTFTDDASCLGNRAVTYSAVAIDKKLGRSAMATSGQYKLEGTGLYNPAGWTVQTNMTSTSDELLDHSTVNQGSYQCSGLDVDSDEQVLSIENILVADGIEFVGTSTGGDPYVIIDMQQAASVEHLGFVPGSSGGVSNYQVQLSVDGSTWTTVLNGTLNGGYENLYFVEKDADYIRSMKARYVKFTAVGRGSAPVSIDAIEIYGPSGDNIEIGEVGQLIQNFSYETDENGNATLDANGEEHVIPAGSLVFTGNFKGNPAYNVVVLFDEEGNIIGGTTANDELRADQIILAPKPGEAGLGNTSKGNWVYWLPAGTGIAPGSKIRAELYRVNDAFTNEGQRLTADTVFFTVPNALPGVRLTNSMND